MCFLSSPTQACLHACNGRYAWVLDQDEEERSRGVTVDVGTAHFETPNRLVNVLDAPGHRDFVPNMIGGAAQADAALLVINAAPGEFEAGLSGQTREHVAVVRALGVDRLLVAVNQMDSAQWAQGRFDEVVGRLTPLLGQLGFKSPPPTFVPLSALAGQNLAPGTLPAGAASWHAGLSLIDEIDACAPAARPSGVGTRLAVSDTYKGVGGFVVVGTLHAGTLAPGAKLLLLPAREVVTVKHLASRGASVEAGGSATAGDRVEATINVGDLDASVALSAGCVLCDPARPCPLARRVLVVLRSLSGQMLLRGTPVECYAHATTCAATIRKFVGSLDRRTGEVAADKKPPRMLKPKEAALVELELEREICLEVEADCRHLGRVVLRSEGETVAAGLVREILK